MQFHQRFLMRYAVAAPLALAIERAQECEILASQRFDRPILDIGCGDGVFAKALFREPIDTGIEPDVREVEAARRSGMYLELIPCHGDRIPKDDRSYRTIFSNSVLEHIPELHAVLREVRRLLAPGGRFYATVPTDSYEHFSAPCRILEAAGFRGIAREYRTHYNRFWRHHNVYDRARWTALFEGMGFRIAEVRPYGPGAWCTLCDLLMPLAIPSFLCKKSLNRWVAIPALRRVYARSLAAAVTWVLERLDRGEAEGLLFFGLEPADSPDR